MDNQMTPPCPWAPIEAFQTRDEVDRFVIWMGTQISCGDAEAIPVAMAYLNAPSLNEKWFKHIESQSIWRLVWPDGPFMGLFEEVR